MKENKSIKKNKILKIAGLFGLFLIIFGISYALFRVTLNGTRRNRIKTGKLDVILTNEEPANGFSLDNATPTKSATAIADSNAYTFDVVNQGTLGASYEVYFVPDSETTMPDDEIMYYLERTDEQEILSFPTINSSQEFQNFLAYDGGYSSAFYITRNMAMDTETRDSQKMFRLYGGTIDIGQTQSFSLKMWLRYSAEAEAMDKVFSGNIRIYVTQGDKDTTYVKDQVTVCNNDVGAETGCGIAYLKYYSDGSIHLDGHGRARELTTNEQNIASAFYNEHLINANAEQELYTDLMAAYNSVMKQYNINVEYTDINDFKDDIENDSVNGLQECTSNEQCANALNAATGDISVDDYQVKKHDYYIGDGIWGVDQTIIEAGMTNLYISKAIYNVTQKNATGSEGFLSGAKLLQKVEYVNPSQHARGISGAFTNSGVSIDKNSFRDCPKLNTVILPDNLKEVKDYAFSGSSNADIKISAQQANVTLGTDAFSGTKSVTWLNN